MFGESFNPSSVDTALAGITLDSPPENVHAQVVATFFNRDQLIVFLKKRGEAASSTETEGLADELLGLADSEFFRKRFAGQWTHESDPKWGEREIGVAVSETVGHMLSLIFVDSDLFIHRGNRKYIGDFPDTTIEGIKKTQDQVRLLWDFFRA